MILDKTFKYRNKDVTYEQLKNHSSIPINIECDQCHKQFISTKYQLVRNGHQLCQQCVLYNKFAKPINVGDKFNRLTVIETGLKKKEMNMLHYVNVIVVIKQ